MIRLYPKEWREFRGLTQAQLAERIGMNPTTISRMEIEHFKWNAEHLEQIALALDIDDPRKLLFEPVK